MAALPSLGSEAGPLLLPSALGLSRLPETLGEWGHRQDEVWGSVTLRGPQTSRADIRGQGEGKVKKAGVVTKEPQVGMWCSGCKGSLLALEEEPGAWALAWPGLRGQHGLPCHPLLPDLRTTWTDPLLLPKAARGGGAPTPQLVQHPHPAAPREKGP